MNEVTIHGLLAGAYNVIAAQLRSGRPDFARAMEEIGLLFDPKGAFNTPTMMLALPASLDRAVIDLREIMERFRDSTTESSEAAVSEIWSVLSRPDVLTSLREETAEQRG